MAENSACLLCSGKSIKKLANLTAATYDKPGYLPGIICRCNNCGLLYKAFTKPVSAVYDDSYYNQFKDLTQYVKPAFYADILHLVKQWGREEAKPTLLDIGAGPGGILQAFANEGFVCEGIEINTQLAERLKQKGFRVYNRPFEQVAPGKQYGVITMTDIIEHLADPKAGMQKVHSLLADNGIAIVYTPNHKSMLVKLGWFLSYLGINVLRDEIFASSHTVFFTPKTVELLFEKTGFKIKYKRYSLYDFERPGIKIPLLVRLAVTTIDATGYLFGLKGFRMVYVIEKA